MVKTIRLRFLATALVFLGCFPFARADTKADLITKQAGRLARAEENLTEAYEAALGPMNSNSKGLFREAQDNWKRFRDAQADFEASLTDDESTQQLIEFRVQADLTEQRIVVLKAFIRKEPASAQ